MNNLCKHIVIYNVEAYLRFILFAGNTMNSTIFRKVCEICFPIDNKVKKNSNLLVRDTIANAKVMKIP